MARQKALGEGKGLLGLQVLMTVRYWGKPRQSLKLTRDLKPGWRNRADQPAFHCSSCSHTAVCSAPSTQCFSNPRFQTFPQSSPRQHDITAIDTFCYRLLSWFGFCGCDNTTESNVGGKVDSILQFQFIPEGGRGRNLEARTWRQELADAEARVLLLTCSPCLAHPAFF